MKIKGRSCEVCEPQGAVRCTRSVRSRLRVKLYLHGSRSISAILSNSSYFVRRDRCAWRTSALTRWEKKEKGKVKVAYNGLRARTRPLHENSAPFHIAKKNRSPFGSVDPPMQKTSSNSQKSQRFRIQILRTHVTRVRARLVLYGRKQHSCARARVS